MAPNVRHKVFTLQVQHFIGTPASWANATSPVVVVDNQYTVAFRPIFNPPHPVQFFRLMRDGL